MFIHQSPDTIQMIAIEPHPWGIEHLWGGGLRLPRQPPERPPEAEVLESHQHSFIHPLLPCFSFYPLPDWYSSYHFFEQYETRYRSALNLQHHDTTLGCSAVRLYLYLESCSMSSQSFRGEDEDPESDYLDINADHWRMNNITRNGIKFKQYLLYPRGS